MSTSTQNMTPFSQHIRTLNRGMVDAECTEVLAELVRAVRATGKKGSMSMRIDVYPEGDRLMRVVVGSVLARAPEASRPAALMWDAGDGDLLRTDPHQGELELRDVSTSPPRLKDIS